MEHNVKFTVPKRPLGNVDIEFDVKRDGKTLGTLKVSKGDVEWRPRNFQYGFHLDWDELDSLMQTHGEQW